MGMFAAKAIKPSKLKHPAFRLEFLNELRKVGRAVKKDYEECTSTWKTRPEFEMQISLRGEGPSLYVFTDSDIFRYVDKGTKPHVIMAGFYTGKSEHKTLAFPSMSMPKTTPGVIGSGPGGSGGDMVHVPKVHHPGTEARGFSDKLQEKWEPLFKEHMEDAMRRAVAKCGHALP